MPKKKDFSNIDTGRVFSAVEQATKDKGKNPTASPAEAKARAEAMQTQGRKGCKMPRITMAFTPSNHEFITVMARASGRTLTDFTNLVIAAYRREHPEIMEQARGFLDTINSGAFSHLLGDEEKEDE